MNEKAHAEKHGRKPSRVELDGSEATITLSPSVLEALQNLHALALAHGPEKFDDDAAQILKSMAYGKPRSVEQTLSLFSTVCAEAGACYVKTDDFKVHEALNGLTSALNAMDGNECPVTVTIEPKTKGRVV
jgi:hypothetical protein